jgi:hypothetical protein
LLIVAALTIISSLALITTDTGGAIFMLFVGGMLLYFAIKGLWPGKSAKQEQKPSNQAVQTKAKELAEKIKQQPDQAVVLMNTIQEEHRADTAAYAVKLVMDDFLEDNLLSENEEDTISTFINKSGYNVNELDTYGGVMSVMKASALRHVLNGQVPENIPDFQMPIHFNFMKSEEMVWAFSNVQYYKEVTRRSYKGGHQGFSVRVAKGLYYRTGAFKGHPVEEKNMEYQDTGIMVLTTKHIYFGSYENMFRVKYNKIVAFTPYDDGLGIMKDTQRAKPMVFKLEDGWMAYNLAINLAQNME